MLISPAPAVNATSVPSVSSSSTDRVSVWAGSRFMVTSHASKATIDRHEIVSAGNEIRGMRSSLHQYEESSRAVRFFYGQPKLRAKAEDPALAVRRVQRGFNRRVPIAPFSASARVIRIFR